VLGIIDKENPVGQVFTQVAIALGDTEIRFEPERVRTATL